MEEYISKSALVAELKKLQDALQDPAMKRESMQDYTHGSNKIINEIRSFLNTLKTKEVDLEKEVDIEDAVHGTIDYPLIGCDFPNIYPNYKEFKEYCDRKAIKDNDKVKL